MNQKRISVLILAIGLLLFSGCFETEFNFRTVVSQDGSVSRETRIDGRGAHLFKTPAGPGWHAKTSETKGSETFLPDTYYHVVAQGKFLPDQVIPSDYQFDVEKQTKAWGEEEKKQVLLAGIKPPYETNLFSRNQIQIHSVKGWLTQTYFYEEKFQTLGEIDVLKLDVKEEIRKKNPKLEDSEIEGLARIRLEDEFLSQIQFQSEISLPGRIVASNATRLEGNKAVWKFSMKDFQSNYSTYTLRVVSRSLSIRGIVLLAGTGTLALILLIVILWQMRQVSKKRNPKKKKGSKDKEGY